MIEWMRTMIQDLRLALRAMKRAPLFATIVIATLAIGIGVNTTMFSIVDAVLLQSLPYPDATELKFLGQRDGNGRQGLSGLRGFEYLALRDEVDAVDDLGVYIYGGGTLTGDGGRPEEPTSLTINTGLQRILGLQPILGRAFDESDTAEGAPRVIMLGEEMWRRRYNADPNMIGRTVLLDEQPNKVVGVVSRDFRFPTETSAIQIFRSTEILESRNHYGLGVLARLKPGVTDAAFQAQLEGISAGLAERHPDTNEDRTLYSVSMYDNAVGNVRSSLLLLWGAVGFVLLLACMNAANLLFARSAARSQEVAVCSAIGSPRRRVIQRVLVESTVLAIFAGVLGLLIAQWGVELVGRFGGDNLPRGGEIGIDVRVFAFTALTAMLTGLLYGLLPALQLSRLDLAEMIKAGSSRGSTAGGGLHMRSALTVGQVSIAIILLVGAGLMIRSSMEIHSTDPGFVYDDVVALQMWAERPRDAEDSWTRQFFSDVTEGMQAIPGVTAASLVNGGPWHFLFDTSIPLRIEGHPAFPDEKPKLTRYRIASNNYHEMMEIPLLAGRGFVPSDDEDGAAVTVVSRRFADEYFDGAEAVGQFILVGNKSIPVEVVGVVGDVRERRLDQRPEPMIYLPFDQNTQIAMTIMVRSDRNIEALQTQIQDAVWAINPTQGIWRTETLADSLSTTLARERLYLSLLIAFAIVAVILASVGIFGVISYSVTRRTREIGIRMALGATQAEVRTDVLFRGMKLASIGLLLGLPVAFFLSRFLENRLYEVGKLDPITYVAVSALVIVVAATACYLPAFRATRIEPAGCLRVE